MTEKRLNPHNALIAINCPGIAARLRAVRGECRLVEIKTKPMEEKSKKRVYCGCCGEEITPQNQHDAKACWDKIPCALCHGIHGYTLNYEQNKRICNSCGHTRDIV